MANKMIVRKSRKLVESYYRLTLQQNRIVFLFLLQIKPGDENFKPMRVTADEFAEYYGVRRDGLYESLRKDAAALLVTPLELPNEPWEQATKHTLITWFSSISYVDGEAHIQAEFHPRLRQHVIQLGKAYNLRIGMFEETYAQNEAKNLLLLRLKNDAKELGYVELSGTDEHIQQCVRLCIEHGLQVKNPELQSVVDAERKRLEKEPVYQIKERFTQINAEIVRNLKSDFSIRAYELINNFKYEAQKDKKKQFVVEKDLAEFRKIMGIESKGYSRIWNIKLRVVTPILKDLGKDGDSDIFVTKITFKPVGRKIAPTSIFLHCEFRDDVEDFTDAAENNGIDNQSTATVNQSVDALPASANEQSLLLELIENGVSNSEATRWIREYGSDYVSDAVAYTKQQKTVDNFAGYLSRTITKGHAIAWAEANNKKTEKENAKKKAALEKQIAAKNEKDKADANKEAIDDFVANIDIDEMRQYVNEYAENGGKEYMKSYCDATVKFKNKIEYIQFYAWLRKKVDKILEAAVN